MKRLSGYDEQGFIPSALVSELEVQRFATIAGKTPVTFAPSYGPTLGIAYKEVELNLATHAYGAVSDDFFLGLGRPIALIAKVSQAIVGTCSGASLDIYANGAISVDQELAASASFGGLAKALSSQISPADYAVLDPFNALSSANVTKPAIAVLPVSGGFTSGKVKIGLWYFAVTV